MIYKHHLSAVGPQTLKFKEMQKMFTVAVVQVEQVTKRQNFFLGEEFYHFCENLISNLRSMTLVSKML